MMDSRKLYFSKDMNIIFVIIKMYTKHDKYFNINETNTTKLALTMKTL